MMYLRQVYKQVHVDTSQRLVHMSPSYTVVYRDHSYGMSIIITHALEV